MRKKSELRDYQQRVIERLYESTSLIAVLRMGAGKTISVLTAIEELLGQGEIRHALIIAPKRVARVVWPDEIRGWEHTHSLKFRVLDGTPKHRQDLLAIAATRQITIVGIDIAQWLVKELEKEPDDSPLFDLLVVDETSKLKDPKSKRARALAAIAGRFRNRWGMTGTPRPNSELDLFNPAKVITAGTLWGRSFYAWRSKHFYQTDWQGYNWSILPGHAPQVAREFGSIAVALRDHEMPQLPELSILVDEITLPPDARDTYNTMRAQLFADLDEREILAASEAIATGKLAQIANGFLYGEGGNQDWHIVHDEKEEWLQEKVEGAEGEPMIVVYWYRQDLAMIQRLFPGTPHLGAGVSDRDAAEAIRAWNAGELPLLALHPASGGHGLNLQQGGSRMAWIAPIWSAELWDQTLARLHRPGQSEHVMVHICVVLDTVDELKRMRVIDKLTKEAAFVRWLAQQRVA